MVFFLFAAVVLTVFSTALLLYVSIATGLGPWISPLLVLIIRLFFRDRDQVALLAIIASFGGAIATGIGFSVTTLYFVDRALWDFLLSRPLLLCGGMAVLVLAAGLAGLVLARRFSPALIGDADVTFPVAQSIIAALDAQQKPEQVQFFAGGIGVAMAVGALRLLGGVFAASWVMPVCWAAGFFAGASLIMPLLIGMASKYVVVQPLAYSAAHGWWPLVPSLSSLDITFALCAGLLLSGLLLGAYRAGWLRLFRFGVGSFWQQPLVGTAISVTEVVSVVATVGVLYVSGMSLAISTVVVGALIGLLHHLVGFASRTGLATYGRYMTLIMIPLLCFSAVSAAQIVLVCMVVGIAGGALVDAACAYKVGQHYNLNDRLVYAGQIGGVVCTALAAGGVLWLLCAHWTMGVPPLVAHRGLSRALLMQTFQFNGALVILGVVLGVLLDALAINATLVFGGLIMPNGLVVALTLGALVRRHTAHFTVATFFWSGALVGDLLWAIGIWLGTSFLLFYPL